MTEWLLAPKVRNCPDAGAGRVTVIDPLETFCQWIISCVKRSSESATRNGPTFTDTSKWIRLIGGIYEVDPLQCPRCGGAMRLVAFILERPTIVRILSHLGEATDSPRRAAISDRPEAARAAFAPEYELQAFHVPADAMPDDEVQRQDVAW